MSRIDTVSPPERERRVLRALERFSPRGVSMSELQPACGLSKPLTTLTVKNLRSTGKVIAYTSKHACVEPTRAAHGLLVYCLPKDAPRAPLKPPKKSPARQDGGKQWRFGPGLLHDAGTPYKPQPKGNQHTKKKD